MPETHGTARLEAFSDGVFAIALTLLIIELHPPAAETIASAGLLWHALGHLIPAALAFLLSFAVILITWVNHHGALRLIRGSSAPFIFANGFLLLVVVVIPFPTALLGEFLGTRFPAPAVVLYCAVLAAQALSWVLLFSTALRGSLAINAKTADEMRAKRRHGYQAIGLYSFLALLAFVLPLTAFVITAGTWVFWLVLAIRAKHA